MQLFNTELEVTLSNLYIFTSQIDPEKMDMDADSTLNILLLHLMCQKFLTQITRAAPQCPWYSYPIF